MAEQAVENNIGLGLFGDDDEEDVDHQQLQQQQYQDDLDADDILGLDDDAEVIENQSPVGTNSQIPRVWVSVKEAII